MSKSKKHDKPVRCRFQAQNLNEGVFSGEKFVKRAGCKVKYTNYNKKDKADKAEWIIY